MKNVLKYLTILTLIGFIAACSGDSPKKTAEKFLNAFNQRNFPEARKYATIETNKLVDLMENLSKMSQTSDSTSGKKIEIIDERIEGEVAYVTFKEEGATETEELKLKKVDGKWLAHVTKEDIAAKDGPLGGEEEEGLMLESDSLDSMLQDTASVSDPIN
ncbi:MAG: DUF4878 domain-containing protein [Bacteroidetes bacterium]|nr:DUF4878 domain-containing protein [Bacteroidota bacterium]